MGRGFLSGIFWGGIVGVALLFVSSQALERQSLSFPKPEATAVQVPGGSEFNQAREETDPVVPEADARPEGDSVAGVAIPAESGDEPPVLDTAALEVPVPATTQDAPETLGDSPAEVSDVAEPEPATDSAVLDTAGQALEAPEDPGAAPDADTAEVAAPAADAAEEDAPAVAATDDAEPLETDVGVASAPSVGEAPQALETDTAPEVASQIETFGGANSSSIDTDTPLPWQTGDDQTGAIVADAPNAPELPAITSEPSLPPVGTDDTSSSPEIAAVDAGDEELPSFLRQLGQPNMAEDIAPSPGNSGETDSAETDPTPEVVEPEIEPSVAQTDENPVAPESEETATNASDDSGDSVLQPVETLTDESSNIVENRSSSSDGGSSLPVVRRFGDNSADTEEEDLALLEETTEDESAEDGTDATASGPALQAFGSAFEVTDDLPLMTIILVHQGGPALGVDIIEALSPHVAFAVDASLPDAQSIARAYRDAGREVVMIPALPAGAAPQDIEQALSVNLERIPEAVAVMDVSGSSFQSDRNAVAQVVDVVADTGHGLITFPRGLNTAHQQAQRAGVPTGLIFRNLDGSGETQEQIRRSLDRAAFRARQDEAVILVGTTGSTMLSALTEWALGNRATTVTIAPVSAALGGG